MSEYQIVEIEHLDDLLAEQLKQLFLDLHLYMKECGMKLSLAQDGEKIWVESVRKTLKHFGKLVVALEGDRLIGFGHGAMRLTPEHMGSEKVGSITYFYVSPDSRKNNIGKKIALQLENWFSASNVHSIELQVTSENFSGMHFWKALGYEVELMQMRKFKK
jgi:ribosomal protein S18 acetylase RimI-like enzyme